MKFRQLGRTGLKVSEICFGTMTFGTNFFNIAVVDQALATQMTARCLEAGVNFFDTADVYSLGESETLLGHAIKETGVRRDEVVIATKVRSPMSQTAAEGKGDFNNVGLSRHHIMAAVEASLKRLGTDYIDLYQVHGWDIRTPLEETMRALDDLVRQGKVRYIGCSNWSALHLAKSLALCRERGWEPFVSQQVYYSLVGRDLEHELMPLSVEEGVGILPWSPLSGGFLSGKFRRDKDAPAGAPTSTSRPSTTNAAMTRSRRSTPWPNAAARRWRRSPSRGRSRNPPFRASSSARKRWNSSTTTSRPPKFR